MPLKGLELTPVRRPYTEDYQDWLKRLEADKRLLRRKLVQHETKRQSLVPMPAREAVWHDETAVQYQQRQLDYRFAAKFHFPLDLPDKFRLK